MTTTTGSLDSNVVLRLLIRDVPAQHAAALALMAGGSFRVTDAALIEVIFVIGRHYGLTRDEQRDAVRDLLVQPMIRGDRELFAAAFDLYLEHPKLSFEDCYLVSAAKRSGDEPLWTFDRKLANQTSARLVGR